MHMICSYRDEPLILTSPIIQILSIYHYNRKKERSSHMMQLSSWNHRNILSFLYQTSSKRRSHLMVMLVISVLMTVIASKFVVSCHMLGRLLIILVCVSDFSTSFSSLTPASTSPWTSNDLFCDIKTGKDNGKCKEESTSRSGSRNRIDDGFAGSTCDRDGDCQ